MGKQRNPIQLWPDLNGDNKSLHKVKKVQRGQGEHLKPQDWSSSNLCLQGRQSVQKVQHEAMRVWSSCQYAPTCTYWTPTETSTSLRGNQCESWFLIGRVGRGVKTLTSENKKLNLQCKEKWTRLSNLMKVTTGSLVSTLSWNSHLQGAQQQAPPPLTTVAWFHWQLLRRMKI